VQVSERPVSDNLTHWHTLTAVRRPPILVTLSYLTAALYHLMKTEIICLLDERGRASVLGVICDNYGMYVLKIFNLFYKDILVGIIIGSVCGLIFG